jgi:tetratricopeptide (TPR) repeat protein
VLAQGVAWIPGRNDSLLCLFLLLSFLFFVRADSSGKKGYFVPHLAFFTLALFTKETALGLPLMVLFYVLFVRKGKLIFYLPVAAGWGMIMFLWSILRKAAFENNPLEMGAAIYAKSIAVNSPGIFLYLGKILLPVRMSVLPLLQDSSLLPGIFASILIALVFVSLKRERFRGAAFGLAWFVVFLLPSFIRPNTDLAADFMNHRIYLPFIGILLVVLEAGALRRFLESRKGLAVSGVVIAALAAAAFFHIRAFREGMSFWTNAVATSPHSPQAQMNLGAMHYLKGNNEAAEKGFREALKLNPREMMAHNNLGLIFMNRGMYAEAEREFAEELKINPFYDDGHFNLALLYYRAKRPDLAAAFWEKTLQINPDHFDAYTHLAVCAFLLGQREKTVLCINELQKRSPERIPALMENLKKLGYR